MKNVINKRTNSQKKTINVRDRQKNFTNVRQNVIS